MVTGLTYIATSLCLWLLVYYLGKENGHETKDGVDIFHYPPLVSKLFLVSMPIYVLFGGIIYSTFPVPRPHGRELFFLVLAFLVIELLIGWAYLYFRKYRIEVDGRTLRVCGLQGTNTILFQDIQKIHLIQGGQSQYLKIFNGQGKVILKTSSTLQDFFELVSLIKTHTKDRGVLIRERDRRGKWKEAINVDRPQWKPSRGSWYDF